jgi:hypothetical protein
MALDNPQLVDFCNDELRQIADEFVRLRNRCIAAREEYDARDLGTIINAGGSSGPVLDGSAVDGRTIATGGDVFNLVTLMSDFATFCTVDRVDVMYRWQVNGNREG